MASFLRRILLVFALGQALDPLMLLAAPADLRCFELRTYTAGSGKLPDLHARFRNHTMRLFEKHGMTNVGYWTPQENVEQKLIYLLAYPSQEAREESWKNFRADPAWQAIKAASDANGPLAAKVEEQFLQATDFSPLVQPALSGARRIFELRTYTATPGNLPLLTTRARNNTEWLFSTYQVNYLGIWTLRAGQPGAESSLVYLLAHQSVEAGEVAFKSLAADKDWIRIKEESEVEAGGPLVVPQSGIKSIYLTPTDYSPLK